MPDREKVISALMLCANCESCRICPYSPIGKPPEYNCGAAMAADALALLLEQEPQEPFYCEADDSWGCGNCGETVGYNELNPGGIDPIRNKYCPECGRKVKWND